MGNMSSTRLDYAEDNFPQAVRRELERQLRIRQDVIIGYGVDESTIDAAEQALSISFPLEPRDYLMRFGHLELGHFEMHGLGADVPPYLNLLNVTLSEREAPGSPLPVQLVPLLNDGGGNLYCICADEPAKGKIYYWDHAGGPNQELGAHAATLSDWIAVLLEKLDCERE
jgi:hypothetical protein